MNSDTIRNPVMNMGIPSVIPGGYFTKFRKIAPISGLLGKARRLPVLTVDFDGYLRTSSPSPQLYLGWGAIDAGPMPLLTFRLQIHDLMVYWLANPADSGVWKALEEWDNAGTMVVAPEFSNTVVLTSRDYRLTYEAKALRSQAQRWPQASDLFLQSASQLILDGSLSRQASSDISGIPLKRVVGCILATRSARAANAHH